MQQLYRKEQVATSFLIGSLQGAAYYFGAGLLGKLLLSAGKAATSVQAIQAATTFIANVVERAGPLYDGLELPKFFSVTTSVGEVFIKQNATEHLQELLLQAGSAGVTKLAAALAIDEARAAIELAAVDGLESIVGKKVIEKSGEYTIEIVIQSQPGQLVKYAVTHLRSEEH